MKNLRKISMLLLLALTIFTMSCEKDPAVNPQPIKPTPNYSTDAKLDLGAKVSAKFFGRIVDESGTAIADVDITAGNKTATTDANGIFMISDANVFEKLAFVKAVKPGYFMGSRSVIPTTTATNNIRITLLKMDVVGTLNSGEAKSIALSSGATIDFEGKYVDANGSVYSGTVNVSFKHLPSSADETSDQMPGMLYAQNKNEEAGVLETFGMMAVELTSSNGAELQIAPDSKATIHMPVDATQSSIASAIIPLWHFDEVAGYWIEEGEAKLINGEYVGEVSHFSFWNCDRFGDDAKLKGYVEDQNGHPLPNIRVRVVTPLATTIGNTASDGSYFTYVPANVAITLEVIDDCGITLQSINVGPYSTNSVNDEDLVATLTSSNSVQVIGTFFDCNNVLITNGYVELTVGSELYYQTVTNGAVDIPVLFCNIPTSLSVVAYDYDNIQETSVMTMPVVSPITNLGNLISCNSITEYITYTIDNGTQVTLFPPFTGYSVVDSLYINKTGVSYFNLSCNINAITVGTYSYGYSTGMTIYSNDIQVSYSPTPNIVFNLNSLGPVGQYIDITFSGSYTDNSSVSHTVTGTVHVKRDI